jgi:hypothetical protein
LEPAGFRIEVLELGRRAGSEDLFHICCHEAEDTGVHRGVAGVGVVVVGQGVDLEKDLPGDLQVLETSCWNQGKEWEAEITFTNAAMKRKTQGSTGESLEWELL